MVRTVSDNIIWNHFEQVLGPSRPARNAKGGTPGAGGQHGRPPVRRPAGAAEAEGRWGCAMLALFYPLACGLLPFMPGQVDVLQQHLLVQLGYGSHDSASLILRAFLAEAEPTASPSSPSTF